MKKTLFLSTLLCISSVLHAAVGDTIDLTQGFVADGVNATFYNGSITFSKTELQNSTRFYDSQKGWVAGADADSKMCWAHTASNMIQYWQSYYGVFYKGNTPLPYGSDYKRELYNIMNPSSSPIITDPLRLNVMKSLYNSGFPNMGDEVATGTNWFFTWVDAQGGYYSDYFGAIHNGQSNKVGQTATISAVDSLSALKSALLPALGITSYNGSYTQTESGLIAHLNVTDGSNPHTLTCYGLTTNADGSIKSLIIADSDDMSLPSYEDTVGSTGSYGTYTPKLNQLYVQINNNGQLELYQDAAYTTPFNDEASYYISGITQINTPEVLKKMLAEYSDTTNEAQVWNGKSTVWEDPAQAPDTNVLPGESTGWDIYIDGDDIATEHHGYYHTYATDGRAVVFDGHAAETDRTVTINGQVKASSITIAADRYSFQGSGSIAAGADLILTNGASLDSAVALNVNKLTLESGITIKSDHAIVVTGDFLAALAPTTFAARSTVTPEAIVNATLDLSQADSVTLETNVNMNGNTLILAEDVKLILNMVQEDIIPCFTNISQLYIGTEPQDSFRIATQVYFQDAANTPIDYFLVYDKNLESLSLMLSIPEPGTATLSLLALAALVTRRRRH